MYGLIHVVSGKDAQGEDLPGGTFVAWTVTDTGEVALMVTSGVARFPVGG